MSQLAFSMSQTILPLTRDQAIARAIRAIPKGKVATYGQVAAAAGYPGYHRQVAQVLAKSEGRLPWHRVVGAGGKICTAPHQGQRLLLQLEGVTFHSRKVAL